jgi:hypothetical protein
MEKIITSATKIRSFGAFIDWFMACPLPIQIFVVIGTMGLVSVCCLIISNLLFRE